MSTSARPVLKWAGGKSKLVESIIEVFPRRIHTYYEPFIGGGAVFFNLAEGKKFRTAVINDVNPEIIDVYKAIRDFPSELEEELLRLEAEYITAPKTIYYGWRAVDPNSLGPVRRAARTIALNKTGFNGLYRTNKQGGFNVPWGKKEKHVNLFERGNIQACSRVLDQFVSLRCGDFVEAVKDAKEGDVVYFDPPYVPLNSTSNFTGYTKYDFKSPDQHRLATVFKELYERGVRVILSNSDTLEVRTLYEGFEIQEIQAKRNINCKGENRGEISELLVVGRRAHNHTIFSDPPPSSPVVAAK